MSTSTRRDPDARPAPLAGLPLLDDLPDVGQRNALVRVDFNVPLEDDGRGRRVVADDHRIRAALPTLQWLIDRGARVTACSHLGRPPAAPDARWDLAPVRERLDALLPGIRLLENLRFSPGEKASSAAFVEELVAGEDVFVNEAFGASHRAHASIVGPPARLPCAAGRQLAREVDVLGTLLGAPARPFVAVVGGAKVSDKLGALKALARKVDVLCVGGAMAFTFLAAEGKCVGSSPVDPERLDACADILRSGARVVLPVDVVVLEPGAPFGGSPPVTGRSGETKIVGKDIPDGWQGLDIGPETASAFSDAVAGAASVLWNGPLGVTEDERFAEGTRSVAQAVAECPGFTVVGGGDSVGALDRLDLADRIDFLSTGGGAMLEFIEKGDLPGLAALREGMHARPTSRAPLARS